jgi:hypothetical protein
MSFDAHKLLANIMFSHFVLHIVVKTLSVSNLLDTKNNKGLLLSHCSHHDVKNHQTLM